MSGPARGADAKVESVVLARFPYRHEAEFAAGFLEEAEIPYRLQVDDAAMGLAPGTTATIWVRAMDVKEAREVLDLPGESSTATRGVSPPPPPRAASVGSRGTDARLYDGGGSTALARAEREARPLDAMERAVSTILAVGCAAAIPAVGTGLAGGVAVFALGALATGFGAGALLGRTLAPLARLVRALSGHAP